MEMSMTEPDFLEKSPVKNDQKWSKMWQKWDFWTF